MKTAIQFGAGNIGRGFIGMLLARAGYKVVFADVNAELIDRLHQDKHYTVHIMDVEKEDVPIDHVDGVLSTGEEIIDEIEKASLITTAVGLTILPRIAPTFAQGIIRRKEEGCKEYLNIIACENAIRGTSQLKEHVYQSLNEEEKAYADEFVGFADCAVDRIVPPGKNEIPTDVVVEQYHEWDVEKGQIKGELPEIAGMTLVDNLDAYIERKLFTLNTGHCITAYVGRRKGYSTIEEAIGDKEIYELVFKAMTQSGAGLVKKHGLDEKAHAAYIQKIIARFKNPYLKDDVTRVGREPLRKLSASDRLVKPTMTAYGFGLPVDALIEGIGAALRYDNPDDPQAVELQNKIAAKGPMEAFQEISGVTDEAMLSKIKEAYDRA